MSKRYVSGAQKTVSEIVEQFAQTPSYKRLLLAWPIITPVLNRLIHHIGTELPGSTDRPLINDSLFQMIETYRSPKWVGNLCAEQYTEIVSALLGPLDQLCKVQVSSEDGTRWNPVQEAITSFQERHGNTLVCSDKESDIDLIAVMAAIIGEQTETFEELDAWLKGKARAAV